MDPRIPNLEAACCPSLGPRLRAPPPPVLHHLPHPNASSPQLLSHTVFVPQRHKQPTGSPWGGPSRYSENGQAAAQRAPGWVSARAWHGVGTWPSRYLLGLLRGLISARLCLSASLSRLLYAKPVYTLGCTAAWRSRGGTPQPAPQTAELDASRQLGATGASCWLPCSVAPVGAFLEKLNIKVVFSPLNYKINTAGGRLSK